MEGRTQAIGASDAAVVQQHYDALRRFAAVVGPRGLEPDDLVHEVLVAILRRGSLTSAAEPLAYLRRALVNASITHTRRMARRRRAYTRWGGGLDAAMASFPSDIAELMELPPRERAVLYLQVVEGLKLTEVAEQLGISHGAARIAASRARRRLRDVYEEEPGP